jgi:RHS repeat-associated protein
VYDGHGRRVRDLTTGSKYSLYSQSGQLVYTSDARAAKRTNYVYLGGSLVAFSETPIAGGTATVKYQHTDALGTPIAVTDASKAVIETFEYEPFGQLVNSTLKDGPGYTGHVQDAATGLTYMQQRYYDPTIGRFLSVDPVTANSGTGGNFNRYWYANNNPYMFTDPDGRAPCRNDNPNCNRDGDPGSREEQRRCAITCLGGAGASDNKMPKEQRDPASWSDDDWNEWRGEEGARIFKPFTGPIGAGYDFVKGAIEGNAGKMAVSGLALIPGEGQILRFGNTFAKVGHYGARLEKLGLSSKQVEALSGIVAKHVENIATRINIAPGQNIRLTMDMGAVKIGVRASRQSDGSLLITSVHALDGK